LLSQFIPTLALKTFGSWVLPKSPANTRPRNSIGLQQDSNHVYHQKIIHMQKHTIAATLNVKFFFLHARLMDHLKQPKLIRIKIYQKTATMYRESIPGDLLNMVNELIRLVGTMGA
jgi:hypothetical protein